jgi:radical SAM protein with 4Fe4S-binding SPASM domain
MFYRQKFDTFIRRYGDVGYITSKSDFGDRVVDACGAVFLSALSRKTQSIDQLAAVIAQSFVGMDGETLKKDAADFYAMLEEDGFIVSGESAVELDAKDTRFSYAALEPKTIKKDFTPGIMRTQKTSQEFLDEHFKDKPHLTSLQIELTSRCNERYVHCYIPHENKVANGSVYPCAGWQQYVCGNVHKQTLRNIWENSPKVKYLRGLRRRDFSKCLNCPEKAFCAMCMVRNANENPSGDPLKINEHFCKVAALNRKIALEWKEQHAGRREYPRFFEA